MADSDNPEGHEPNSESSISSSRWSGEDPISSLSSQLALQRELCTQYELDLAARDELVNLLHERVDEAAQDRRKRRGTMKELKAKAATLEKACRGLRELEEQLKDELEHSDILSLTLQEREERFDSLAREHRHALETVSHLEQSLHHKDAELDECSQRLSEREAELEAAREELRAFRLERSTTAEAQTQEEVERLRRQVRELQKESADKEVKITQLSKQRAQDREDLGGLNIALDSKQQELELLKRRLGVRGTAGTTPAQPSKISHRRRESSIPFTPRFPRLSSLMSDTESYAPSETPSATAHAPALGNSVRISCA